jgi:hypothetical protein
MKNLWQAWHNTRTLATMKLMTISNMTTKRILCPYFKDRARKRKEDFTRKNKMPFERLIRFILQPRKCSTNTALRRFFKELKINMTMKQQSLSDARKKLKPEALREIFMISAEVMVKDGLKRWHGYRVFAIDGTTVQLPTDAALGKYFGTMGKNGSAPTARTSILYDILNDGIADAYLEPLTYDERTLAEWHINHCSVNLEAENKNLFIYDRGYPSFSFIEKHINEGYHYVMRVKRKQFPNVDAQTTPDGHTTIEKDGKSITVRVIKFTLDSGEEEVLITNLEDARMGVIAFKKLYFLRWPIESKYDIIKNKLALEALTSETPDGILQDFYATLYLANIVAAAISDAQPVVNSNRNTKGNKHEQRININEAIGILKDRLIWLLTLDDDDEREDIFTEIIMQLAEYTVPVRLNRSNPRKPARKAKFRHNQKLNC